METLSSDVHAIRRQPHADEVSVYVGNKNGGTHVLMSKAQAALHSLFQSGRTHTESKGAYDVTFRVAKRPDGTYFRKWIDTVKDC